LTSSYAHRSFAHVRSNAAPPDSSGSGFEPSSSASRVGGRLFLFRGVAQDVLEVLEADAVGEREPEGVEAVGDADDVHRGDDLLEPRAIAQGYLTALRERFRADAFRTRVGPPRVVGRLVSNGASRSLGVHRSPRSSRSCRSGISAAHSSKSAPQDSGPSPRGRSFPSRSFSM
jgi:hypothetical protein